MNDNSIGGRVRSRSRSRNGNRNNDAPLAAVPLLDGNRSLIRNARIQREEQEQERSRSPSQPSQTASTETSPPSLAPSRNAVPPAQQQQEEKKEEADVKEDESVLQDVLPNSSPRPSGSATSTQQRNEQIHDQIHPERRSRIPNNNGNRQRNMSMSRTDQNRNNAFMHVLQDLQQQIAQLRIQQTQISTNANNAAMPGFNTVEQQTKLTVAESSSVYRNLSLPEPVVENARPTAEDRKQYKELFSSYENLTKRSNAITWFTNFEYACNVYKVPTSIRYLKLTTKLFDEEMKQKFMAERLHVDLTSIEKIKNWLLDIPTVRAHVAKELQAIFNWKQKAKTLVETYKDYKRTVMNYVRAIKTAHFRGLPKMEIEADKPSELKLHNIFVCGLQREYRQKVYRTMEDLTDVRNVAVLEVVCEYLDKISTGKLGINLKSDRVTQSILYSEYEQKEEAEVTQEMYYMGNNTRATRGRGQRGRRPFYGSYRGRNFNRTARSTRNQRKFDNRSCYHCGLVGHVISACWKLYPDLKKKYFQKRAQINKTKKLQKGDLLIINEEGKLERYDDITPEETSQYEIYCMEHDKDGEFKFENFETGNGSQETAEDNDNATNTTNIPNETTADEAEQPAQQDQLEAFFAEYLYPRH